MTDKPIIYQVFTRLYGNRNTTRREWGSVEENGTGKFSDFDAKTLKAIKQMGVSHIWYTGVIRHASQTDFSKFGIPTQHPSVVKGKAGSPYAICDYYDVDPDLADNVNDRMKEFEALVSRTHKAGLKMFIDFVPNHVARQYHSIAKPKGVVDLGADDDKEQGFNPQNNFYYCPGLKLETPQPSAYSEFPAKATGNDNFTSWPGKNDWYETVKLNYGPNTYQKMLHILLYWAAKGIDGFRCDMAEMVPVEFWEWALPQVKAAYPNIIFIAEVYNPSLYRDYIHRGHFDYLYDKVGLYDTLLNVCKGQQSTQSITACWQAVDDIRGHMLNFLENHDEQRIASKFFAGNPEKGKPALLVSALMNTNPMMIYFGQELGEQGMYSEGFSGQDGRTTIFDYWTIDLIRRWRNNNKFDGTLLSKEEKELQKYYTNVLNLCNKEKAIREGAFFDIMYVNYGQGMDEHRQFAFLRKSGKELIFVIANFDDKPARSWVKIPAHAFNCLDIPVSTEERDCKDLLTGKKEKKALIPDGTLYVELPANGGKVLKFKF